MAQNLRQTMLALIGSALAAASCGGKVAKGSDDVAEGAIRPGFTAISTCDLPKLASFASDTEADYIEVRRPGNGRLDGGAPQIEVVDTFGEPCRAATDVPSCLKRLDAESW